MPALDVRCAISCGENPLTGAIVCERPRLWKIQYQKDDSGVYARGERVGIGETDRHDARGLKQDKYVRYHPLPPETIIFMTKHDQSYLLVKCPAVIAT